MKENIESVLQLLKHLQPILTRKTISKICENSNEKPYFTNADIVEMFTSEKVVGWELELISFNDYISIILHFQTSLEVKEDLHSAQFLIIKNPKWGISLIDVNDDNGATMEILDTLVNIFIYFSFLEMLVLLIHLCFNCYRINYFLPV